MAWNKGAEEMYGWRADEALGRHIWEVVPVGLSDEQRAKALRELEERGRFRTEAVTYRNYGTPVYVEGITIALRGEQEEGQITGYVNIRRDITERKRAKEALSESSRRIEDIFERITDQFYAFDRAWRFTYINERALGHIQRAKGEALTRDEVLGKNMWELYPELAGSVCYQKYHEALREPKTPLRSLLPAE
ncbi:MAG: PAS domain S-box protein [Gammaproteobacteria bacterium]|nr:PAS domain S-box protein [Gammaproteobacteria bacterium]